MNERSSTPDHTAAIERATSWEQISRFGDCAVRLCMTRLFRQERELAGYGHETNDCTVRAIMMACQISYSEAHQELRARGRKIGSGIRLGLSLASRPVVRNRYRLDPVWRRWKNRHGLSVKRLASVFPTGFYVVLVRGHAFALRDGRLADCERVPERTHIREVWRVSAMHGNAAAMQPDSLDSALL